LSRSNRDAYQCLKKKQPVGCFFLRASLSPENNPALKTATQLGGAFAAGAIFSPKFYDKQSRHWTSRQGLS
jgi:hypothetical protein